MYDLIVVVPYRDRLEHLKQFVPHLEAFLSPRRVKIIVVEQSPGTPFNRGKLLNVGFSLARKESDLFAFHDVDMLPMNVDCDYNADEDSIVHLAGKASQFDGKLPYPSYLGGVVVMNRHTFVLLNGYHNDFWGWGVEDDDLALRAKAAHVPVKRLPGEYQSLDHDKSQHNSANLRMWQFIEQMPNVREEGLTTLDFKTLEQNPLSKLIPGASEDHLHVVVDLGLPSMTWNRFNTFAAFDPSPDGMRKAIETRGQCVILVPAAYFIDPNCNKSLMELDRRGYGIRTCIGSIAIDKIRNQLAKEAIELGYSETMWIDSDVAFDPDDVDRIRAHGLPIVAGLYLKKNDGGPATFTSSIMVDLPCGEIGGITEIKYAATGFMYVRCEVYNAIAKEYEMPLCNEEFGEGLIPYFMPMISTSASGKPWYLSEDFAFCERARKCGYPIYADTKIRLKHYGMYGYSWDDMAPRHRNLDRIYVKTGYDATVR